ncbi:MAG TPA: response regulator [Campylobacteraceae bacterium]|nr:response regulator [Campylobacteraceae bacterium]HHD83604.1 response regulator [Campylobacteraceae bacterium]
MNKTYQNQTYKDLQSLFRLFLGGIFILGALNYIFTGMIDDLDSQTKNLETKKLIEEKISASLMGVRENISDLLLVKNEANGYFREKLRDKLDQITHYLNILKSGGALQLTSTQQIHYKPESYSPQFDSFNTLAHMKLRQDLAKLRGLLQSERTGEDFANALNETIKHMQLTTNSLINQTIYQINRLRDEIALKKDRYVGYELLAIIFVIGSLLYLSNLISKQIIINSDRIEAANKEAQKMALKAKQASKAKSDFLANMSHEIRTPLNAILGFIDLLREKESDPEKLKYIQTIQSSSNTLLGIINDILDFSKIESNNLQIEKIDFNTYEEMSTLADLFRAKASEKSVSLTINMQKDMPKALVSDPLRIKQVIANLLSNAIKFTPRNGRVELAIGYKEGYFTASVKDNGIGIPEEKQADIFKAFSQAETSTTRKFGGTGLGLTISSKLVQMLGGELKLESRPGHGSRFYFSIPVEPGKYKAYKRGLESETANIEGRRILLVEDNKANQMFMSLILKKFSLIFDIANDGVEAVEKFRENYYDLILMDENMPNLNGIEATKQILEIEKRENRTHTPVVALTANALKGDRERFLEAGMDEYLTKPVNKEKLVEMFNKFITPKKERVA